MRLRNVKDAKKIVSESNYAINDPESIKGHFSELFGNDNEIHLEIGMGKGDFIIGNALKYPNINFIGMEKYESVMVRAIEKLNDATYLDRVFDHEITLLYLNFSDPWPKKKHAKRRLTSPIFLKLYDNIFKGNPHIVQKTYNIGLFAYSLETLSNYGYKFNRVSLDLENEDIDNVCTEYEKKFMSLGIKINYVDAVKK